MPYYSNPSAPQNVLAGTKVQSLISGGNPTEEELTALQPNWKDTVGKVLIGMGIPIPLLGPMMAIAGKNILNTQQEKRARVAEQIGARGQEAKRKELTNFAQMQGVYPKTTADVEGVPPTAQSIPEAMNLAQRAAGQTPTVIPPLPEGNYGGGVVPNIVSKEAPLLPADTTMANIIDLMRASQAGQNKNVNLQSYGFGTKSGKPVNFNPGTGQYQYAGGEIVPENDMIIPKSGIRPKSYINPGTGETTVLSLLPGQSVPKGFIENNYASVVAGLGTKLSQQQLDMYSTMQASGMPLPAGIARSPILAGLIADNTVKNLEANGQNPAYVAQAPILRQNLSQALGANQKQLSNLEPFIGMLDRINDAALHLIKTITATDARLLNKPLNALKVQFGDNPDYQLLSQMLLEAKLETSRITATANATGAPIHHEIVEEWNKLFDPNQTLTNITPNLEFSKKSAAWRLGLIKDEIQNQQAQLAKVTSMALSPGTEPGEPPAQMPPLTGKTLTRAIRDQFLKQAGGNHKLAESMLQQAGYDLSKPPEQ
jgi:hypothetical protein